MAARKPIAVATVTATPAPNSCLVKAADSAVHTARVRAETERKKFVAASDKKHRKHRRHHRDGSSTTTGSTEVKKPKIDIKKRREKPTQSFEEILRLAKVCDAKYYYYSIPFLCMLCIIIYIYIYICVSICTLRYHPIFIPIHYSGETQQQILKR